MFGRAEKGQQGQRSSKERLLSVLLRWHGLTPGPVAEADAMRADGLCKSMQLFA